MGAGRRSVILEQDDLAALMLPACFEDAVETKNTFVHFAARDPLARRGTCAGRLITVKDKARKCVVRHAARPATCQPTAATVAAVVRIPELRRASLASSSSDATEASMSPTEASMSPTAQFFCLETPSVLFAPSPRSSFASSCGGPMQPPMQPPMLPLGPMQPVGPMQQFLAPSPSFQGANFQGCVSPSFQGANFQGCVSPRAPGEGRFSVATPTCAAPPPSPSGHFALSPGVALTEIAAKLAPLPPQWPAPFLAPSVAHAPAARQPLVPASGRPSAGLRKLDKKRKQKVVVPAREGEHTLMLRQLPLALTPDELLASFGDFRPSVDFYYLPTNFESKKNLGYAFVNFTDRGVAQRFSQYWEQRGAALPCAADEQEALVVEARVQGYAANVERFRNSSVMAVLTEDTKPRIFCRGVPQAFPQPDKPVPAVGPRFKPTDDGDRSRCSSETRCEPSAEVPVTRPTCWSSSDWPAL